MTAPSPNPSGYAVSPSTLAASLDHPGLPPYLRPKSDGRIDAAAFRVLLTVIRPELRALSVADRAQRCHLSPSHYVRMAADPAIQELAAAFIGAQVTMALPAIVDTAIASAMVPGKDGTGDRKLVLELSGYAFAKKLSLRLARTRDQERERRAGHLDAEAAGIGGSAQLGPQLAAALARAADEARPQLDAIATPDAPTELPAPNPGPAPAGDFLESFYNRP